VKTVTINGRTVGPGHPAYIIAEIGSNHDQDKGRALDMIRKAAACGVDAVKFQSLKFDEIYQPEHETAAFRDWFAAIQLPEEWYADLASAAKDAGVDFLSAPCYPASVPLLDAVDVPAYKLGSPQVQGDSRVTRAAAACGKPMIMSVGYCYEADIQRALDWCAAEGNYDTVLLHCVSKYPTNFSESNLAFMQTLAKTFDRPVGFSDHTPGGHLAVAAVALGACVVEKHVTDDRARKGPDHNFALTFEEFARMVREIRELEAAMGSSDFPNLLPDVLDLRRRYRYKAFAARDLRAGEAIEVAAYRSEYFDDALGADQIAEGATAKTDIAKGQPIRAEDVQ